MGSSDYTSSSVMAVLTKDGVVFWSSPGWGQVSGAHGLWRVVDEPEQPGRTLASCLEQRLSQPQTPGKCRMEVKRPGLPIEKWTLESSTLPGTQPHLHVVTLCADAEDEEAEPHQGAILLVDDEPNIINALKRSLRRSGYTLYSADGGAAGLAVLEQNRVDVIISDQRMPGMTGVEFLRQAHERWPHTIRISLSGYTDLQSVTDAINEGAIYKFITKPWEDPNLLATVEDAFARKRNEDRMRQLQLALAGKNEALRQANDRLTRLLAQRQREVETGEATLAVTHETFSAIPVAVLGTDSDGLIVVANDAAEELLGAGLVGSAIEETIPADLRVLLAEESDGPTSLTIHGEPVLAICRPLHSMSGDRGKVLTLIRKEAWK